MYWRIVLTKKILARLRSVIYLRADTFENRTSLHYLKIALASILCGIASVNFFSIMSSRSFLSYERTLRKHWQTHEISWRQWMIKESRRQNAESSWCSLVWTSMRLAKLQLTSITKKITSLTTSILPFHYNHSRQYADCESSFSTWILIFSTLYARVVINITLIGQKDQTLRKQKSL